MILSPTVPGEKEMFKKNSYLQKCHLKPEANA